MNDNYEIVLYRSEDCPDEVLKKTAAFYAYIFNNASDHFFVHRKTGQHLGKAGIPELKDLNGSYVPNATLKNLHAEIYDQQDYALWHHEEVVYKNIKRKLRSGGLLVLLLDTQADNQIKGFSFGRRCTLSEALKTEEWINPYVYSELQSEDNFNRTYKQFLENINCFLQNVAPNTYTYDKMTLDTPVYCWNAAGLAPELQGKGLMKAVNDRYFGNIPEEFGKLLLIGEASDRKDNLPQQKKRTNLQNFERVGAKKIMKMADDLYLIGVPVHKFVRGFMGK